MLSSLLGQGRIPLLSAGARPPIADPVEVRLTVADQVEDAVGHARADAFFDFLGCDFLGFFGLGFFGWGFVGGSARFSVWVARH